MYAYQYVVGGALSLFVTVVTLIKGPRTPAMKTFSLFGLAMTAWEFSSFCYRSAPSGSVCAEFFTLMTVAAHLGYPLYVLTFLNVQKRINLRTFALVFFPFAVDVSAVAHPVFVTNFQFNLTEFGWTYRLVRFDLLVTIDSIAFVGYMIAIIAGLLSLTRQTGIPFLRRKYAILLASFVVFHVLGIFVTNSLIALDVISPVFQLGGIFQLLTFVSIWYALSQEERETPPYAVRERDFPRIYSSFLSVYYNSILDSKLGEEAFKFTEFVTDSRIEDLTSLDVNKVAFQGNSELDLTSLINRNLAIFTKGDMSEEVIDQYLRVLNAADKKIARHFADIVLANEDFLKKSDLIYGISNGRFLRSITEDASLKELDDVDACLKIYKRILLPVIGRIHANPKFREKLSEYYVTQPVKISDYGEISMVGVKERLSKAPRNERMRIAVERFNSVLSVAYEELLADPDADVAGILEKLMLVLRLNKDRAMDLGVYLTLLGTLATKIPRTQIHRLYSHFLEELVEERTRELKETQHSLLKSQRLVAIGEAAAMVGHDLRNPLQAIVNTLYLAERKLEPSSDRDLEGLLRTISDQVEHMNKVVSDLQDYARPVKPKLAETDLDQSLNEALSVVEVPEDIKVFVKIEDAVNFPKLMVDPQLMKRVFVKLITNAIQAMPEGGQLVIEASASAETVSVSFRDTGAGIPKENLAKVFHPLFTTRAKGHGLGLAVCKRLVEAHEGKITVESEKVKGATFTIEMPSRGGHRKSMLLEEHAMRF